MSYNYKKINPVVSIIVPVYNGADTIELLITSLLQLSYPREAYEIIIIDNGSTDETLSIVSKYSDVQLLHQTKIKSSYASRNVGIRVAKGDIIAFTDADCVVHTDWLTNSISLFDGDTDIIAGSIHFTFSDACTAAEQWDSLTHMKNDEYVKKGKAATANVLARKIIFSDIGMFDEVASGGDGIWVHKAVQSGYKLIYVPEVIVYHPARLFHELMQKYIRVGFGALGVWKQQNKHTVWKIIAIMSLALPIVIKDVNTALRDRGVKGVKYKKYVIICIATIGRWCYLYGIMKSIFIYLLTKSTSRM